MGLGLISWCPTAISLPSVAAARLGELSPIKRSTHKSAIATAKQTKKFVEILTKARDAVFNVHTRAVTMGSSTITHSVASMLSQIIVLLSAVTSSKGKGPENPMFASYSLGEPLSIAKQPTTNKPL